MNNKRKEKIIAENTKSVITDNTRFPVVEAYKLARTNLMFAMAASDKKVLAVTSWAKSDGKSTVASNISISLSKLGKKILLIDADLRRPNVNNLLKVNNDLGLSDILGKFKNFNDVVKRDVLPNLDVVTSGVIPPNPSELLGSTAMKKIVEAESEFYDYIVIDTPPIGLVSDAIMIKDLIAGFLFVIKERSTTHGDIEKIMQTIKIADSNILGFVQVDCDLRRSKSKNKKGYEDYYM